jgi:LemA protein
MAKFTENRALARAVLIAVIAFSILISGSSRLRGERSLVSDTYTAPQGIYTDLAARAEAAYNLCDAAKGYHAVSEASINSVSEARGSLLEALKDTEACGKHSQADASLDNAAAQLYSALSAAGLNDADASFARKQYAEFTGRAATIARNEYNESARAYNAKLRKFPAGLIGTVSGVKPLELYGVN